MTAPALPVLTVALIQDQVAEYYRVKVAEIRAHRRARKAARPRQVAMYLAATLLPARSFPWLGREFGRDRTTVAYAVTRVARLMDHDSDLAREVDLLRTRLLAMSAPDALRELAGAVAEDFAAALRHAVMAAAESDPAGFLHRAGAVFATQPTEETPPCAS